MDLVTRWPLPGRTDLRDELLAAYSGDNRGYHDVRHLAEVLDHVGLLAEEATDLLAVELAAWFHDAVYDRSALAEERSAELATTRLTSSGLPDDLVAEVARLVRLTADHRPAETDRNGRVLCDADLAVLASGVDRYDAYVTGVRREYAHVSDEDFRRGRAEILRRLLAKPSLFHTDLGRRMWEQAGRANLERELNALEG